MKTRNLIALVFILLQTSQTFGNDRFKNRIRFSAFPLGYYTYVASFDDHTHNYFSGGEDEMSLSYEFIPFKKFGFEAFIDFYGYKYQGYKNDDNGFVRFYGIPAFTAGLAGVLHPLKADQKIDLFIRYGMGYAHYWVSEKGYYPGFGATAGIGLGYKVSKHLTLGIETGAHYASYKGGTAKHDPSFTENRAPFELMSFDIGISTSIYF